MPSANSVLPTAESPDSVTNAPWERPPHRPTPSSPPMPSMPTSSWAGPCSLGPPGPECRAGDLPRSDTWTRSVTGLARVSRRHRPGRNVPVSSRTPCPACLPQGARSSVTYRWLAGRHGGKSTTPPSYARFRRDAGAASIGSWRERATTEPTGFSDHAWARSCGTSIPVDRSRTPDLRRLTPWARVEVNRVPCPTPPCCT